METKNPILVEHGLRTFNQKMKYDKFVLLYMISFNSKECYRQVFATNNEDTLNTKAHLLLKHPYIIKMINKKNEAMEKKMDEKALITREGVLRELQSILDRTKNNTKSLQTSLKALDQISKVIGAYAPIKEEVTHKGVTINYVKPDKKS